MKTAMMLFMGLLVAVSLAEERPATAQRQPKTVIRGMENTDPEIREHFNKLLAEGFESVNEEASAISVSENDGEKFVIFDTGSELRMYLLIKDGEGYDTAIEVAVDHTGVLEGEGEGEELVTILLQSNPELINRSIRKANLRKSIKEGMSTSSLALQQAELQAGLQQAELQDDDPAAAAIDIDCVSSGSTICCGFVTPKGTRIVCVCNSGGKWLLCFDSGWLK